MKLPRLALRDLFWLVALVAMGCGRWVDQARIVAREAVLEARAKELEAQFARLAVEQDVLTVRLDAAKQTLRAAQKLKAAQGFGGQSLQIESPAHEALINGESIQ